MPVILVSLCRRRENLTALNLTSKDAGKILMMTDGGG